MEKKQKCCAVTARRSRRDHLMAHASVMPFAVASDAAIEAGIDPETAANGSSRSTLLWRRHAQYRSHQAGSRFRADPRQSRDQHHGTSWRPSIINRYLFALEAALQLRDKFGSEITALTTVDAERRAEPGVQILRTNPLANHGGGNEPDLPSVMTAALRAALGPIVKNGARRRPTSRSVEMRRARLAGRQAGLCAGATCREGGAGGSPPSSRWRC